MKQFLRTGVLLAACLALMGAMTGCDKAEQALEKTDLGAASDLTGMVSRAVETLGGIHDVDSAKSALPKLKEMDGDLGQLVTKFNEMSPEKKSQLTAAVKKVFPQLEGAIDKVTSLTGVGEVVGPTLASFQEKFKSMM